MKHLQKTGISFILILCFFANGIKLSAQDSAKAEPSVGIRYFSNNNNIQYLLIQTRVKIGKKFQPLPKQVVKVFMDGNDPQNLITKTSTNDEGKAKVIFPPELKDKWNASEKHNFIAVLEANSVEDERTTELEIIKAKITLDTSTEDGVRSINVKVVSYDGKNWVPAKDVEMKIGVDRSGGILSAGEAETYTTDSTGMVSVEFKRDSLPGDPLGNFVIVAKVEDNDQYGNMLIEKTVPWGVPTQIQTNFFDQRTLWTTRFRTPMWLLFMAYSIVIGVWGTIIYLIMQIVKIAKMGSVIP